MQFDESDSESSRPFSRHFDARLNYTSNNWECDGASFCKTNKAVLSEFPPHLHNTIRSMPVKCFAKEFDKWYFYQRSHASGVRYTLIVLFQFAKYSCKHDEFRPLILWHIELALQTCCKGVFVRRGTHPEPTRNHPEPTRNHSEPTRNPPEPWQETRIVKIKKK